jgi:hypothetical protein
MFKSAFLALSLTVSSLAFATPAIAQTGATKAAPAPVDPVRLKLAEVTVLKLIPPGTYSKIMKDMMDTMAGGLVEQMMGMDASMIAGIAGEEGSEGAEAVKGKTMADIAAEKDPAFKERMDITMKVMFSEMGNLMSEMEPVVRTALSSIYAKKYSAKELGDMNAFFATPSGATFAGNFMATFTDKEMMDASFGMMPKMLEAMPAIMKKVEAATAHLPPLAKTDEQMAVDAAAGAADAAADAIEGAGGTYPEETGDEPWYNEDNWKPANRKKATKLSGVYEAASEKSGAAYSAFEEVQMSAIDEARQRYLADGWKPDPNAKIISADDEPMAAEDIPANAPPPPVIPK